MAFNQKITFVIGAGAGKDGKIGMPLGTDLLETITADLNIRSRQGDQKLKSGDANIMEAISIYASQPHRQAAVIQDLDGAFERISKSIKKVRSIDNYLANQQHRPATVFLGKMAIANAIAKWERKSKLFIDLPSQSPHTVIDGLKDTWLYHLLDKINLNNNKYTVANTLENLTFINFNYDRCVEHYLYHGLKDYWELNNEEISNFMSKMKFFHPYGTLGKLEWESASGAFSFGGKVNAKLLLRAPTEIKTFTEHFQDEEKLMAIQSAIAKAKTIVFLGFGYHEENLQLLSPKAQPNVESIYGTAFKMPKPAVDRATEKIKEHLKIQHKKLSLAIKTDGGCDAIFNEYDAVLGQ